MTASPVWKDAGVHDAVARYRTATEANDIDGVMETLAPDAELVSPISGRMVFRGKEDLRVLLTAVYGSLGGVQWGSEVGDDRVRVVMGDSRVGPLRLGDAMVFELAEVGGYDGYSHICARGSRSRCSPSSWARRWAATPGSCAARCGAVDVHQASLNMAR